MADFSSPDSFDFEVQNQAIARRQALAQALQTRAMKPMEGSMVSGRYVGPGWGGALASLTAAGLGGVMQRQGEADQTKANALYRDQLGKGLQTYLDKRSGKPGDVLNDAQAGALMDGDQAPAPLAEPVQADPRAAMLGAMTSRMPELQKIGQMDFANSLTANTPKLENVNGVLVSVPANGSAPPKVLGDYRNAQVVNQKLVGPTGQVISDQRDKYGPVGAVAQPSGGPAIYGQTQADTGEVKFAPGGSTFSPDKTGNIEALQQTGKVLEGTRTAYLASADAIRQAQQIMTLSKDPQVNTGFAAGITTGLQGLGAKLGITGPDAPAKTQALVADLSKRTLDAGQQMKGSFSDSDIQFLKAVSAGSIDLTPQVLQHVAGLSVAAGHNAMLEAHRQHSAAEQVTGAGQLAQLYSMPVVGDHTLDDSFPEIEGTNGRVRYKSPLLEGSSTAGPASAPKGTAGNPMTYEEYKKGKQ